MAKTVNPLFSITAHGRFGGLVYSSNLNGSYVKGFTPQTKKPSPAQVKNNLAFGMTADAWRELTDEQKEELNVRARPLQISGFNLYIKEHFQENWDLLP